MSQSCHRIVNKLSPFDNFKVVRGCTCDYICFNNPIGLNVVTMTTLSDNSDNQLVIKQLSPNLGCHSDNFLVVPNDKLDNFLDDNPKVVIVTIRLTTFRQLFVLCVYPQLLQGYKKLLLARVIFFILSNIQKFILPKPNLF